MLSPVPGLLYVVRSSLYVSLTNESNTTTLHNSRGNAFSMSSNTGFDLLPDGWLPEAGDVSGAVAKAWEGGGYDAVVYAGMGEPTLRLEALLSSCSALRKLLPQKVPIRLNTNGLGSEHAARDISLSLHQSGLTHVSIALNTSLPSQYHSLMASPYGERCGTPNNHTTGTPPSARVPGQTLPSHPLARDLPASTALRAGTAGCGGGFDLCGQGPGDCPGLCAEVRGGGDRG
uniref:Radical SAM core domain-containing protein n=1 Tax=Hemiselmis andersenii TaxID=464988 RepID=A0A6T8MX79_HEMAN|mmetsp:Transcript_38066/g.88874  ORF Transcript_38066/g.88874 Transcript_38066/m.88874 type:complete len:231 (-) Transcript_38066:141-833(-)